MRPEPTLTTCGAPLRRPTTRETLERVLDALQVPRHTPWDEVPALVALRCRPLDLSGLRDLIEGSLALGLKELGELSAAQLPALAERVARPLHAVLVAQHQGLDPEGAAARLEDLSQVERRVLAAVCLLGASQAHTANLAWITRLASCRLEAELRRLEERGVLARLRRHNPADGEEAWWPTPAWHSRLEPVLDFTDLVPAVEERLAFLDQARRRAS